MPGESLRDQLQSVYDDLNTEAPTEAAAPAPAPEVVESPAPAAEQAPAANDGAPVRDEQGRFAPKTPAVTAEAPTGDPQAAAPADLPETAKPAGEDAPKEPTRVPPSLPAAIKAQFATLAPDVQQAFIGLEDSVQKAKAEWGKKGERLNRYDELFAPRREQLAMRGLDEVQAVQMLFAAQDLLDRNPVHGLLELARSYGVSAQHLAQQMSGGQPTGQGAPQAPGQPPGFDPNALQSLVSQALAPFQQKLQAFEQQTEAQKTTEAHRLVDQVRNNPKNLYWEDVKQDVALLVQNGVEDIQDAYDRACWANPNIRPLLIQAHAGDQQREAAARAQAQQRQAADQARSKAAAQAAGSVTGAPQGAQPAIPSSSSGNLRQDLQAAYEAAQAQV